MFEILESILIICGWNCSTIICGWNYNIFMKEPTTLHVQVVNHILSGVEGTINYVLNYGKGHGKKWTVLALVILEVTCSVTKIQVWWFSILERMQSPSYLKSKRLLHCPYAKPSSWQPQWRHNKPFFLGISWMSLWDVIRCLSLCVTITSR